ncbi:hypothetical protein HK097_000802 [Rhizophlyctis rosea]|uniref:Uncharacterized protein n=1 Tax=Rhizophlyctis rosea TaxID=64517 RepID=A0AAD5S6B1_9FUNG|nr:hypothetical protein HK097_000802 [Rhizophlyctis rosea]
MHWAPTKKDSRWEYNIRDSVFIVEWATPTYSKYSLQGSIAPLYQLTLQIVNPTDLKYELVPWPRTLLETLEPTACLSVRRNTLYQVTLRMCETTTDVEGCSGCGEWHFGFEEWLWTGSERDNPIKMDERSAAELGGYYF